MAKGTSLLVSAALLLGCSALLTASEDASGYRRQKGHQPAPDHVVLIALDGVRQKDVFFGADAKLTTQLRGANEIVPNLSRLAQRGVALGNPDGGVTIRATGPNYVSLPGYMELLTGREPLCTENDCETRPQYGLVDAFLEDGAGGDVAIISSWERVANAIADHAQGPFVSAGRTGDLRWEAADERTRSLIESARLVDPAPGHGDYRPDARTTEIALSYLEAQRPRFAFVSLGDTDELAHAGDYDGYLSALSRADDFIGRVASLAESWRADGERTAIFVTTDHGRSVGFRDHGGSHPESADVWLIAAGDGIEPLGEIAVGGERRLRDVAHTIAALVDVPFNPAGDAGAPIDAMLAIGGERD